MARVVFMFIHFFGDDLFFPCDFHFHLGPLFFDLPPLPPPFFFFILLLNIKKEKREYIKYDRSTIICIFGARVHRQPGRIPGAIPGAESSDMTWISRFITSDFFIPGAANLIFYIIYMSFIRYFLWDIIHIYSFVGRRGESGK